MNLRRLGRFLKEWLTIAAALALMFACAVAAVLFVAWVFGDSLPRVVLVCVAGLVSWIAWRMSA